MGKSVQTTTTETDSVTLKKNAKGMHDWEIKCYGDNLDELIKRVNEGDIKLSNLYKSEVKKDE